MPNYIFAYHESKKPASPEEGAALMAKWKDWVSDLGDTMVNPGTPVGMSKTVSADGVTNDGGATPLMGFSVVQANDINAAITIAKTCPHLEIGTIKVAEMLEM